MTTLTLDTVPQQGAIHSAHILKAFDWVGVERGTSVIVALDVSGGCPGQGVLRALTEAYEARLLRSLVLIQFDTLVRDITMYHIDTFKRMADRRLRGGGGTMLRPVLEIAKGLRHVGSMREALKLVVISDCFFCDTFDPDASLDFGAIQCVFVSHEDWPRAPAPQGKIHLIADARNVR